MTPGWLRGPIATVFTAFDERFVFDETGQRNLLDFLLQSCAISAYFVRSGMGQMYTFHFDDVKQIARIATSHLQNRAPVLVGTSGIWDRNLDKRPDPKTFIDQAKTLTRYAEDQGAAGTVHVIPEAIAPEDGATPGDVTLRYFEAIAAEASQPVLIYQPPPTLPQYRVTPDLARRLGEIPVVKGIKLSTADAGYLFDVAWAVRDADFEVICGDETAYYAGLCYGARSVIGQGCCVNPAIVKAVVDRFDAGDCQGAMAAQDAVNRLCAASPPAVEFLKRYATELGYPVPPYARPAAHNPYVQTDAPLTEAGYNRFKALLETELARY